MIIILHVLIAFASLSHTTYVFIRPSIVHFRITYTLVALTLLSGLYLVLQMPSRMVQACTSGLTYIVLVSFGIVCAHIKLARSTK